MPTEFVDKDRRVLLEQAVRLIEIGTPGPTQVSREAAITLLFDDGRRAALKYRHGRLYSLRIDKPGSEALVYDLGEPNA